MNDTGNLYFQFQLMLDPLHGEGPTHARDMKVSYEIGIEIIRAVDKILNRVIMLEETEEKHDAVIAAGFREVDEVIAVGFKEGADE